MNYTYEQLLNQSMNGLIYILSNKLLYEWLYKIIDKLLNRLLYHKKKYWYLTHSLWFKSVVINCENRGLLYLHIILIILCLLMYIYTSMKTYIYISHPGVASIHWYIYIYILIYTCTGTCTWLCTYT